MNTSQTALVTGGAGFIGSHLTRELLSKGYTVISIDNLSTGRRENTLEFINNPFYKFREEDVSKPFNELKFVKEFKSVNFVYHFASPASPPKYRDKSIETMLVNSIGTYNMLEFASSCAASFVLASTSEIYGNPLEHPQKETYYGNVNTIGLRSCYDESKRFSESLTMEYVRKKNLDAKIVRIFNTYGPNMDPEDGRVVSNFIMQALRNEPLTLYGDGSQTRSLCYVSDLIHGIIKMMENDKTKGEVVNLGNPNEMKVKDIGELVIKLTGSKSALSSVAVKEKDDPDKRKPDIEKAKSLLCWEPKVSPEDGILKTIEYFKKFV